MTLFLFTHESSICTSLYVLEIFHLYLKNTIYESILTLFPFLKFYYINKNPHCNDHNRLRAEPKYTDRKVERQDGHESVPDEQL